MAKQVQVEYVPMETCSGHGEWHGEVKTDKGRCPRCGAINMALRQVEMKERTRVAKPIIFVDRGSELSNADVKRIEEQGYIVIQILGDPDRVVSLIDQPSCSTSI